MHDITRDLIALQFYVADSRNTAVYCMHSYGERVRVRENVVDVIIGLPYATGRMSCAGDRLPRLLADIGQ